ncbi:MAG: GNAT family N-acetyltransferase [Acidimicrobiales bacterium]
MTSRYSGVEELTPQHLIDAFDCGSTAQTNWFRKHALQSQFGGMSRVFVVRRVSDGRVVGYYALTTGSVLNSQAPARLQRGAGKFDIPIVILTRLGVDSTEQGKGVGRALVVDAFRRVDAVSQEVGVRALLIHAEDHDARSFYLSLAQFEESPVDRFQLLLMMKDLRRAIQ